MSTPVENDPALVVEVLQDPQGQIGLQIIKQKYRCDNFFQRSNKFVASNGFQIISNISPGCYCGPYTLLVCGAILRKDRTIIIIPDRMFLDKCRIAIREYNQLVELPQYTTIDTLL